jgi:hypothetical protein
MQKALGALDSRDSLRASVALLPVVLASSGFVESASPFQSTKIRLRSRQNPVRRSVLIRTPLDPAAERISIGMT